MSSSKSRPATAPSGATGLSTRVAPMPGNSPGAGSAGACGSAAGYEAGGEAVSVAAFCATTGADVKGYQDGEAPMVARSWKDGSPAKFPTPGRRWFPRKEGHLTFLSNFRGHEACMLLGRVRMVRFQGCRQLCILPEYGNLGSGLRSPIEQRIFQSAQRLGR